MVDNSPAGNFYLDVSAGDVLREPFEILEGQDWLGFAGIPPAKLPAISREEQFAEKVHAYTLPRPGRPDTRVKDLVNMLLLFDSATMDPARLALFPRSAWEHKPLTLLRRIDTALSPCGADGPTGRGASRPCVPTRSVGTR